MARSCTPLFLLAFLGACGSSKGGPANCPAETVVATRPEPAPELAPPKIGAIPFDLPRASEIIARPLTPDGAPPSGELTPMMHVEVSKDGSMSIDGQKMADQNEASKTVQEKRTNTPEIRAVIFADRTTPWSDVILVFDLLKRAGIARLAFAVRVE